MRNALHFGRPLDADTSRAGRASRRQRTSHLWVLKLIFKIEPTSRAMQLRAMALCIALLAFRTLGALEDT